jgi:hypothetical protein
VIATAYAALLFLSSQQTYSGDFSDVPWFRVCRRRIHTPSTIIIAYFHICNNNFHFAK